MTKLTDAQRKVAETVSAYLSDRFHTAIGELQEAGIDDLTAASIITQSAMMHGWNMASRAARNEGREPVPDRFIEMAQHVVARKEIEKFFQWRVVIDERSTP